MTPSDWMIELITVLALADRQNAPCVEETNELPNRNHRKIGDLYFVTSEQSYYMWDDTEWYRWEHEDGVQEYLQMLKEWVMDLKAKA